MERCNLKKLNEVDGKEHYQVETLNRFAALKNLDSKVDINSAMETVRENIQISAKESLGYYEFKRFKPLFDERCPELLYEMKEAKLQRLQQPSEINGDNPNNVRHEVSRHFRNKRREYQKTKLMSLQRTVRPRTLEIFIERNK
jgi:hypothetical protein